MDFNIKPSAHAANGYDSASTGKTGKTGKQNILSILQGWKDDDKKGKGGTNPQDTLDISEKALENTTVKGKGKDNWKDFDMDAFHSEIRNKLMQSVNKAKDDLMKSGVEFAKNDPNSLLYNLTGLNGGKDIQAAKVPDYWNAENTSQRIVDFAMSFRGMAPELSDEEYIGQIRAAVQKGFGQAKSMLGDMPGPSAKLYNDTYNLAMKKFDDILAESQAKKNSGTAT
jgi:hypothetical protein